MGIRNSMEENDVNESIKFLRRDIKRAKVFCIHHLTRRIRLLSNKRGTEQQVQKNARKAGRLLEEVECIKDLDVNVVLKKFQNKIAASNTFGTEGSSGAVLDRALARLITSKPIQSRLQNINDKKDISSEQNSVDNPSNPRIRVTRSKKSNAENHKTRGHRATSKKQTAMSSGDECEADEEILPKRLPISCFVNSMASDARDDNEGKRSKNKRKSEKGIRESSNRLGQRARQRLWKDRYGDKANHVRCNVKAMKTRNLKKPKPDKKGTKPEIKPKVAVQETVSHPSWEASKRRKLEHSISHTQFQGQKIVFDDSD